ncbi:MAG: class I SAM-dependent methyltransferase [Ktedonobacteraceae bacterium]|nr:class I SAM-dependent methyltransferase [Ktedonobacteraceae bacterium]MBO0791956.1 class I SAM-dependent methyltransferase [Ktedonobacteraceae bacterium]
MDQKRSPIKHISDTARWMAYYQAMESERPNACFHDPYARLLAGLRGKVIAHMLPWGINNAWAIIVRTCIFDEIIVRTVENSAVDTILNLAAGFDTRPYRLPLPPRSIGSRSICPRFLLKKKRNWRTNDPDAASHESRWT